MKTCPYCGEEIKGERIFCKHCGHYLPAPKAQQAQEKSKEPKQPRELKELAINDSIVGFILFVVGLIIMLAAFIIALVYPPL